jgi:hypothetical protein
MLYNYVIILLDGIAPQCAVPQLSFIQTRTTSSEDYQARRIRFAGESKHLNFRAVHSVSSYEWIFTRIKKGNPGFIEKR